MSLKIAVVGAGYWGPNIIRNFNQISSAEMAVCCDQDTDRLKHIKNLYPNINPVTDFDEVLKDPTIDAVAVCTHVSSHYPLSKKALEAGKHVLVEKPFTAKVSEAEELVELAAKKNLTVMIDHTFEYTAGVNKMKEIIKEGLLGDILYINCSRLNLGIFQRDVNVVWDLAPHDLSIIMYALGMEPVTVRTVGMRLLHPTQEDVAFVTLGFENGAHAVAHVSWVDPHKVRSVNVVGTKQMLVYDDLDALAKIQIFDKCVDNPPHYDTFGEFLCSYHYGDIHIPRLKEAEPLNVMCRHFIECVESGKKPRSSGESGLRMVKILAASDESLRNGGKEISLK
ncbi:MAG: Gfo/Idh/MocA family oxidoreductase [Abditibacteriota bacterium]|nr:Gfo/Idh/MocA family oxidoreductase [Abditibacteriota bacterium]